MQMQVASIARNHPSNGFSRPATTQARLARKLAIAPRACHVPPPEQLPSLPQSAVPEIARSLVNSQQPKHILGQCLSAPELSRLRNAVEKGGQEGLVYTWGNLRREHARASDPRIARNEKIALTTGAALGLAAGGYVTWGLAAAYGLQPGSLVLGIVAGTVAGVPTGAITATVAELLRRNTTL